MRNGLRLSDFDAAIIGYAFLNNKQLLEKDQWRHKRI